MRNTIRLLTKANHIFDRTLSCLAVLAGLFIIFLMLGISTEVVLRDFWNRPIPWMVEVTEYSLLWITFLGAAWLLKREGHVKMDMFLDRLEPRMHCLASIIISVLAAIVCAILIWYTTQSTWNYFQTGYVLPTERRFPIYPIFMIIPIGTLFLLIQFLRRTFGYLQSWRQLRGQDQRGQTKG